MKLIGKSVNGKFLLEADERELGRLIGGVNTAFVYEKDGQIYSNVDGEKVDEFDIGNIYNALHSAEEMYSSAKALAIRINDFESLSEALSKKATEDDSCKN